MFTYTGAGATSQRRWAIRGPYAELVRACENQTLVQVTKKNNTIDEVYLQYVGKPFQVPGESEPFGVGYIRRTVTRGKPVESPS